MNAKQRIVSFLDKQGFYIVLALCLVVISVTAVLSLTRGKKENQQAQNVTFEEQEQGQQANYVGENMVMEDVTSESRSEADSEKKAEVKLSLARPVQGDVIMEFAKDKLLYNSTLKQWTTHEGIDIAADSGTAVKAALGGTVESVNEDALMGYTVVLTHENGYKTVYANLEKDVSVSKDDKVAKDQELGKVGKTAISEFDMEPHLHFELISGEERINPMEFMSGIKVRKQ